MTQLALPGILPICPACRRPADLLGQWSPFRRDAVCRTCSTTHPYPIHILEPHPKKPGELRTKVGTDHGLLNEHTAFTNWLWDATRGCREIAEGRSVWQVGEVRPCELGKLRPDCRLCQRRSATGGKRYLSYRTSTTTEQQPLPICDRCGRPHEYYRRDGVLNSICERCEMERSVEALFRLRSIFDDQDDESILDRLYASHRGLFEARVLPDYWFELKRSFA